MIMNAKEIESRIKAEYKKHKKLDWAKIAAKKNIFFFNSKPNHERDV